MDFNNSVAIKRKKRIHNQDNYFPISSLVNFCNSKVICLNYTCVQLLLLPLVRNDWWWVVEFTHPTHMKLKFSHNFFQTHAAWIKLRKRSQRHDARRIWRKKKSQRQREYSARTWSKKSFATRCSSKDLRKKFSQRGAAARIWRKKSSQRDGAEQIFAGYVQGIIHYIAKTWSRVEQLSPCLPIFHCVVQTHCGQPAKPITNSNKQTEKRTDTEEEEQQQGEQEQEDWHGTYLLTDRSCFASFAVPEELSLTFCQW